MSKLLIRRVVVLLTALFLSVSLFAQGTLSIEAPKAVTAGEDFQVYFKADGKISDFHIESFGGLEKIFGPTTSVSSSTQIINGKRTESSTYSYVYLLQAPNVGKYTIPSATATVAGKKCRTEPFVIEVVANATLQSGDSNVYSGDIRLLLTLDKYKVIKGEPVSATLKLYVRNVQLSGVEDIRLPKFEGFWKEETQRPQRLTFEREVLDGQVYDCALIAGYLLFPQNTGKIEIDPAQIKLTLLTNERRKSNNPIDMFFNDAYNQVSKRFTTPKVTLEVDELPSNAPSSFAGAVGQMRISVTAAKDSVKAHEATSLVVTVSGNGNLNMIDAPKIVFPSDFEVYDTKKSDDMKVTDLGYRGSRSFEYPFVPRSQGEYTIAPVVFSYYDTQSRKYRELVSDPITIKVMASDESEPVVVGGNLHYKKDVKNIGEDIRYIKTKASLNAGSKAMLVFSPIYYIVLTLIILLFLFLRIYIGKRIKLSDNQLYMRNKKALKVAKDRLRRGEHFMKENNAPAFYEEIHKAVYGYLSDKLMVGLSVMNRESIESALVGKEVPGELVNDLLELIDRCEYARYAPAGGSETLVSDYENAVRIISNLESYK